MSDKSTLKATDVAKLMSDPSADNRAIAAEKVASAFTTGGLGPTERALAEDIFRLMVKDVEVKVRQSLSQSIRLSNDLPHDVAISLANDVEEVAIPVIEAASVLTDDDLIAIIQSKPANYQVAVAGRANVSEKVSDVLVDTKNEDVVARLVANDGASLSDKTMTRVLDEFGHVKRISNPMAERAVLPMQIAERLVNLVSDRIRDHLVTHHELSADMAMDLLLDSRERATLHLLDGRSDAPDVFELVDQLAANGRLSQTIILRALCMGDLTFFEAALAKKAGIPVANAYQLIHDKGEVGLKRLFKHCGFGANAFNLARIALAAAEELTATHGEDRASYQEMMLERVMTAFVDEIEEQDLDYFIARMAGTRTGQASTTRH